MAQLQVPNTLFMWAARHQVVALDTPILDCTHTSTLHGQGAQPDLVVPAIPPERSNTVNPAYPYHWVLPQNVVHWGLTLATIHNEFPQTWNLPYPHVAGVNPQFLPIQNIEPQRLFYHEAGVTNSLSYIVFADLSRVLGYIFYGSTPANQPPPTLRDQQTTAVTTDSGSGCDYGRKLFLPDRAVVDSTKPAPLPDIQPDRQVCLCPGDIKPSYKFEASWYYIFARTNPLRDMEKVCIEFRKVIAQIAFYMVECAGENGPGERWLSARYGYIITNNEVMLLERTPTPQNQRLIRVSDGFPLRGQVLNGQRISGMLALIYIHLKASRANALF
ncbi:unnamed protein product [Somion occarium]|uniref:Uncharacterized protein n=1 Tax=Somion occarium TaxID=3059160 RepID=A0ABP1CVA4_9APHY